MFGNFEGNIRIEGTLRYSMTRMLVCFLTAPSILLGKSCTFLVEFTLGEEAKKLFDDAQKLLTEIKEKRLLQARGIVGLFPAFSENDDIIILSSDGSGEIGRLHGLRQQVCIIIVVP